jgi:hypothetical protein
MLVGCACCLVAMHRKQVRTKYGIVGGTVGDVCASLFCHCCTLSQISREIAARESLVRVTQQQPQPPVVFVVQQQQQQQQPPPVAPLPPPSFQNPPPYAPPQY